MTWKKGEEENRMGKIINTLAILCISLVSLSTTQEKIGQNIAWDKIREAFRVYCESPSIDNANKILSVMPTEFDNRTADFQQWVSTSHYIWEGEPFRVLRNLVRNGDTLAIRIAFKTLIISDGAFAETLLALIGGSIRANPEGFLEEAKVFIEYAHRLEILVLDTVLPEYYGMPDESLEAFKKEILVRITSLETVTRPDLFNLRNDCISKLKNALKANRS